MTVADMAHHVIGEPMHAAGDDDFHFEGPEKKLDIIFARVDGGGLRRVPQSVWSEVCKDAKCSILHCESNDQFDAYLLSESSLFIYADRMIAKTCGQTTLLNLVPHLFTLGEIVGTLPIAITYGHYRYRFPDEQVDPHRSFEHEHAHLDKWLPGVGRFLTLAGGEALAADPSARCWHMYAADLRGHEHLATKANVELFRAHEPVPGIQTLRPPQAQVDARSPQSPPDSPTTLAKSSYHTPRHHAEQLASSSEETVLEVAMEGLAPAFTQHFFFPERAMVDAAAVARASGIEALMPGVQLSSWCFDPCGFSLNGLRGQYYFTIHITPEPLMSFGSFETNDPAFSSDEFLASLLAVFLPAHATVLVTARSSSAPVVADCGESVPGYRKVRATPGKFPAISARCVVLERDAPVVAAVNRGSA